MVALAVAALVAVPVIAVGHRLLASHEGTQYVNAAEEQYTPAMAAVWAEADPTYKATTCARWLSSDTMERYNVVIEEEAAFNSGTTHTLDEQEGFRNALVRLLDRECGGR